jgi:adenylosuccinate lyase
MISRYEIKDISHIWDEKEKFHFYLLVEIAHLKTLEEEKIISWGISEKIKAAKIDLQRIAEIEKTTNHDVIAFCSSITEQFSQDEGRFFHFGLTSSDIIDTAHALMIKESINVIEKDLLLLKSSLHKRVEETSDILCIGRSHGISAEAMIFAQKFLSYEAELDRRIQDWKELKDKLTGQISGAVGNYTVVTPEQEEKTIKRLGLKVERVSSQVIPRDHYAKIISTGSLLASLFERMAIEFRLLQHSDIDEVREGFSKGQKGSSSMPHKKNPISSENMTGMARMLRSHLNPALENCALWHERDISHSCVERIIFPDHFGLLAYSTRRMIDLVNHLEINREKILKKVTSNHHIFSSYVLHKLIEVNRNHKREDIYLIVQQSFFKSVNKEELIQNLTKDLEKNNLQHDVSTWISLENLKKHYVLQFQKILKRNL